MKFRRNARLKPGQVNDKRVWMGAARTGATGADGAEKPLSVDQARSDELSRRYGQTVYTKPYQPVGHTRYMTPKMVRHGNIAYRDNVTVRPDGADRTQPFKAKYRPDGASVPRPKQVRVRKRPPVGDIEMPRRLPQKEIPFPKKTQRK